jgi:perosamine synthetase
MAGYDFKGNFQDVLALGALPVLVDLNQANWNIDANHVEAAIGSATRAIIVSHLHGGMVDMPAIMQIAQRAGIAVLEDACQVPGATVCGRIAGSWGDVGVLSFGGSKLLSAGRGGAFLTNNADVVQRARLYSYRGNEAYPLSELQAAVLVPQLDKLDVSNQRRSENVSRLQAAIVDRPGLRVFDNALADTSPGYYKLGFQYDAELFDGLSRDDFVTAMRAEGIAMDAGFRALHAIHSSRRYRKIGDLPIASDADQRVVVLHHPVLLGGAGDVDQIIAALDKVAQSATMIRERAQGD